VENGELNQSLLKKETNDDRSWDEKFKAQAKAIKEWNEKSSAETRAIIEEKLSESVVVTKTEKANLDFPEEAMYGEAGVLAREMHVPLGLAYPALIGGLFTLIGDKASGKRNDKTRVAGPRKLLLLTHEMTDVLSMTGLENSTLAPRFCDLWDDPEFIYPTKDYNISVNCRVSWVGDVPCTAENPARFTELFGAETSHGLYDRMILGYSEVKFNYRAWKPKTRAVDYDDYAVFAPPFV